LIRRSGEELLEVLHDPVAVRELTDDFADQVKEPVHHSRRDLAGRVEPPGAVKDQHRSATRPHHFGFFGSKLDPHAPHMGLGAAGVELTAGPRPALDSSESHDWLQVSAG
jgi:hypothetical protein